MTMLKRNPEQPVSVARCGLLSVPLELRASRLSRRDIVPTYALIR
jgi:hypothetical protein